MPSITPPQHSALIIGRMTGVGLDRDAALIRHLLEEDGLTTDWKHPRQMPFWRRLPFPIPPDHELVVFLERVFPSCHRSAKKSVLIPNQERFPHRHLDRLKNLDAIFCKTLHATKIFSEHHPNVHHLGFTSTDRYLPESTPDYSRFFHLAGSSTLKGTEEVIAAWSRHPEWPTLTLVIHEQNAPKDVPANIELISRRLDEEELLQLQNQCGIHLCPSHSEGWGHYIVEAMSCRAVTVTTDGPPMNELIGSDRGILVPFNHSEPRHLGTNYHVTPEAIEEAVTTILRTPADELAALGSTARQWFTKNDQTFRARFHELTTALRSSTNP